MLTKPFPFIDCNKLAFAHVVVVVAVKGARADGKTPDGQKYSDVCELDEVKLLLVAALAGGAARPPSPASPAQSAQTAGNAKAASPPASPRTLTTQQQKGAAGGKSADLQKDSKQTLPVAVAKAPAPGKTSPSNAAAAAGTHAPTAAPPPRRGK